MIYFIKRRVFKYRKKKEIKRLINLIGQVKLESGSNIQNLFKYQTKITLLLNQLKLVAQAPLLPKKKIKNSKIIWGQRVEEK